MATCLPSADILNKISESWELLTTTFGDLTHSSQNENFLQNNDILSSLENLCHFDLDRSFIDWYYNEIREYLKEEIVEPFRNKSKNILSSHYRQLIENINYGKKLKLKKRGSISSVISMDENNNNNQQIYDENKKIELMNFKNFDIKIYINFLSEISSIIDEVYCEIFKIKNNIRQIGTLLNVLKKGSNNKALDQRLNILIDTIFLMDGSDEFEVIFGIMFSYSFIYFGKITNDNNDDLNNQFISICNKLYNLRWLKILESVFINVAYGNIEYQLLTEYKARKSINYIDYGLFEKALLNKFKKWVNQILIKWLQLITNHDIDNNIDNNIDNDVEMKNNEEPYFLTTNLENIDISTLNVNDLAPKIEYFVYEKFGEMRTTEMFDIIISFPQSIPALNDLKECLNITSEWRPLQISMLSSFKKRLLHHGASSKDIITQYIATIGALKILDPTGITLEIIGEPMRIYLRERDDAIRCVVSHLMENDTSLLREFKRKKNNDMEWQQDEKTNDNKLNPLNGDNGNESDDSIDSDIAEDAKQWEPDPLDSMFAKTSIFKRNSDTIGLLVKIFGSREIFVEEYRKLLSDRLLLRQKNYFSIDKETEYLELMKLRFGDESMEDCQVMVNDIINSQRDSQNIQQIINTHLLDATIISSQYWPQQNGEEFKIEKGEKLPYKLPPEMNKLYQLFENTYAQIKKPREIFWLHDAGCVHLEIILNQQMVKIKTKPINASLLIIIQQHFDDDNNKNNSDYININDLCTKIGMNEEDIMSSLTYWIRRGIIKRVYDNNNNHNQFIGYRLCDGKDEEIYALNCLKKKTNQNIVDQHDNISNAFNVEKENILADFQRSVIGLLTYFQGKPIEGIMSLLKKMKLHPLYANVTMNQLQNILDKLTNEKRIIFQDGMYKRPRT